MNIYAVDLNLLPALDALLSAGNVTRAARQMGITQPAMSNTLARIRELVGDPVLVRHGRTMVPTPAAMALKPVVRKLVEDAERALLTARAFEPATVQATLRLGLSDFWHFALLPKLVTLLAAEAPGVTVQAAPTGSDALHAALPEGRLDAAVFLAPREAPGIESVRLVDDNYVAVVRRGHPLVGQPHSLESFASFARVLITPRGPGAQKLDAALSERGLAARVVLETAHIDVALDVVAGTDYLTVVPSQIAWGAQRTRAVELLPLPIDAGSFSLALYWHERTSHDAFHKWMRHHLATQARAVYANQG